MLSALQEAERVQPDAKTAGAVAERPKVRCRTIEETDLDTAIGLLRIGFADRSEDYWREGLARHRAQPLPNDVPRYGYLIEKDGDAVGVLAGFPVEIAPTAQALWMRGASLTMLHQPTPRTDLAVWAEDTMNVIAMIEAAAVIVSEPFLVAIPVLEEKGIKVLTIGDLLEAEPIDPVETGEDDLALMQLTSGSTGSPKAVQITHRNIYSNAEAMFVGAEYDVDKDVMVSWLPCFHDMGMVGFLTIPMYFGAELVKVTPMDFLRDTLL